MSKSDKLLEKMRSNPRDDWRIDDLKVIAKDTVLVTDSPERVM
jgi:hypothetical protein